jgi:hypothetical protein
VVLIYVMSEAGREDGCCWRGISMICAVYPIGSEGESRFGIWRSSREHVCDERKTSSRWNCIEKTCIQEPRIYTKDLNS